ncbi:MAG: glycoside hydrolase family 15 protein [Bacteroidota bacterium]|nr:glycoside hydrolase family 15 protein [Bacteroidota bacterium]
MRQEQLHTADTAEKKDRFLHPHPSGYEPIGSYALIGNCRSAALVSRFGSIDWLCWPRFDSPAVFCALLDSRRGGTFSITPQKILRIERRYRGETNVLITLFHTADGTLKLTDLMTLPAAQEKKRKFSESAILSQSQLPLQHEILRIAECVGGTVSLDVLFKPRPAYGADVPSMKDDETLGLTCQSQGQVLCLNTDASLSLSPDQAFASGTIQLRAGEQKIFSFTSFEGKPSAIPPLGEKATNRMDQTLAWWEGWSNRCLYRGPYRKEVMRSALVLKLLVYAPTGAIIAAPTTSLPEAIGEGRNWDYRYCWLRDASLSVAALLDLGYYDEGEAFLAWILKATRATQPDVRILYDVFGNSNLAETMLEHLAGYRSSPPVRIGNAAKDQLQLDVYGEILLAVKELTDRGGRISDDEARFLEGIGEVVLQRWKEPDEGIWETRAGRFHHTYSKAMCWSALNTLIHLYDRGQVAIDREKYAEAREAIREDIEQHAYNEQLRSYTGAYGEPYADASLLLLGYVGFTKPGNHRMQNTYRFVRATLLQNGLLRRYPPQRDGLKGNEGTFGLCSLWEAQYLVREKKLQAATKTFRHFLSFGNDVGLFAEEIQPKTGEALGNFPQAFTHLGIIDVALSLENRERTVRHHL